MVLKFRLISDEQDDFIRDFEILADQTFFDFHMAVQDNLHFDKSQIASFFTCSGEWEKELEITLFELTEDESANVITMENARIGDLIHEIHDKLIYDFDVFNERLFFIELVGKNKKDPSKTYPHCSLEEGNAPQQLLMDQLFGTQNFSDSTFLDDPGFSEEFLDTNELEDLGYDSQFYDDELPDE